MVSTWIVFTVQDGFAESYFQFCKILFIDYMFWNTWLSDPNIFAKPNCKFLVADPLLISRPTIITPAHPLPPLIHKQSLAQGCVPTDPILMNVVTPPTELYLVRMLTRIPLTLKHP